MKKLSYYIVVLLTMSALILSSCGGKPASASQPLATATVQADPPTVQLPPSGKLDDTPRLAIISAFDAELKLLLDATVDKQMYVVNGRTVTTGKIEGIDAVLTLSGVSMVNAAMNTQAYLDKFNITGIVFSGIAGGVNPDLSIGDVVVPKQWGEYQEMTFAREVDGKFVLPSWTKREFPNFGMMYPGSVSVTKVNGKPDEEESIFWFQADPTFLKYAEAIPSDVLKKCDPERACLDKQPILKVGGNGVDGQTFVDNAQFRNYAWETFHADSLSMETAAVAQVAHVNGVPFIGFRSLSDLAGGGEGENEIETFFKLAADNSAGVVKEFLKIYKNPELAKNFPTPIAASATESSGDLTQVNTEPGKFNVAWVFIGPHNDGGWSESHFQGVEYVQRNVPGVHTVYVENIPEGADSEQMFRSLARKGFNLIFGTSFGYMDPMEVVAADFPDVMFVHVSGYKSNGTNFGNLFGAMESMKYLAGMVAGARAKQDENPKLGYVATFPIPEELRLGNAFMLGARKTCPECTMDVRWINSWHDPVKEKDAAKSLFDAGAQVVLTGADTPANADVAQEVGGKWAITYDLDKNCKVEQCLTTIYWKWGPEYARIVKAVQDHTYKPGWEYFDVDSDALGIYGFMEGQILTKGESDLPAETISMIRDTLAKMQAGTFTRLDVFSGPIKDNKGKIIVPDGEKMEQADLDQFPPGAPNLECKYCMYWWAEGTTAELPGLN